MATNDNRCVQAGLSQWQKSWLDVVLSDMVSLLRAKAARAAKHPADKGSIIGRLRQLRESSERAP